MSKRERLVNRAFTNLDAPINSSQTTITVFDGSLFPSEGDFRIICDDELMLCTARSGNSLTVVRGIESTAAVSHLLSAAVIGVFTAESIPQLFTNDRPWFGRRPPLRLFDASGTQLSHDDLTWVNQGLATSEDSGNSIIIKAPVNGFANVRAKVIPAPATPYAMICGLNIFCESLIEAEGQPRSGIIFHESATGEMILFCARRRRGTKQTQILVQRFNSATSFNSEVYAQAWVLPNEITWLKIEDNGTNLNFYISPNAIDWEQVHTEGRTAFMATAPDEVGIAVQVSSINTFVWGLFHSLSFE